MQITGNYAGRDVKISILQGKKEILQRKAKMFDYFVDDYKDKVKLVKNKKVNFMVLIDVSANEEQPEYNKIFTYDYTNMEDLLRELEKDACKDEQYEVAHFISRQASR